jgi:tRNA(Ile2) C34 agmatinyltransferase TiaS
MTYKGICHRHRAQEGSGGIYANSQKRCHVCQIYMKCDGLRCPFCKSKLRTKSRNSAFKKRLADAKKY